MLDSFLKVAYETQLRRQAHFELVGLMEGLPVVELRKLADGTPIAKLYGHLDKNAYLADACGPDGTPKTFLDKFKGTPLFEQAVALEQEELQAEMTDMQKRQERRQQNAADDSLYDTRDRIRVQKRLLELELAKVESGAAPAAGVDPSAQPMGPAGPRIPPPAPLGAGAPTPPSADPAKVAADSRGARRTELQKVGSAAGAVMAKTALGLGSLGQLGTAAKGLMNSGMAQKALSFAAKNPAAVGAGIGAAGGAIAGGPDHRLSGALGGAALGAGAGHLGGKVLSPQGGPVGGITAKLREATMATPPGAMSAAPVAMKAPMRADPSVLGGPQRPGSATLTPPNPMDFSKKPGFLSGFMR